ncbi:MAG: DUF5397 family protein [Magnetococcales bacterium]|nr:DUF5397 family protein [Magnetococcales bacterium]
MNAPALAAHPPPLPKGTIKSFGPLGPKYAVDALKNRTPDGDWVIGVTLVETGEETDYLYSQMKADPEAA